jgi:hypothetical protein
MTADFEVKVIRTEVSHFLLYRPGLFENLVCINRRPVVPVVIAGAVRPPKRI